LAANQLMVADQSAAERPILPPTNQLAERPILPPNNLS
jgi:hypothetical protein